MLSSVANELEVACDALEAALEDYLNAYATTQRSDIVSEATPLANASGAIPDTIANEYPRVIAFDKQIKRAKAAISAANNGSSVMVPMNMLPADILVHIFRFVSPVDSCEMWPQTRYNRRKKFSKYPILFTHVCARWRQLVVGTPLFWSHIDITPELYNDERLWNRTQGFITRTGRSALDIHIATAYPTDEYWEAGGLNKFLSPLIPRMRSLDLEIEMEDISTNYDAGASAQVFFSSILSNCFGTSCTPGTLTRVSLKIGTQCPFLESTEDVRRGEHLALDVPSLHLQDILRPVTSLKLQGLFPFWTSVAYSGLVELSLGIRYSWIDTTTFITEFQLADILSSSPRLRRLNFGLLIVPSKRPPAAVVLSELEVLILKPRSTSNLESVARLLVPGLNPLDVTIYSTKESPDEIYSTTIEIAKLFARSNITSLHFEGVENHFKLLSLVNTLQTLTLSTYSNDEINIALLPNKPFNSYLEKLILTSMCSGIVFDDMLHLTKVYAPHQLFFWGDPSSPVIGATSHIR